jgi:hypothetical protein
METVDVANLKTAQIAALTTTQVVALTTDQVTSLTTAQVSKLTTAQVAKLTTDQVVALTTGTVTALTTAGIAALTTNQLVAMETADVAVLKTAQIAALTTAQIVALTTDQITALTTGQVEALTTTQMAVITTDQVSHLAMGSPIILDLNGNGVQTLNISSGVKFDLFADGESINTGWVSSGDGLLVLDRNHDGNIKDGSELFGSATTLANGERAADGYQALRELDSNSDGVIDSQDAAFADLRVWVDGNSDGVSGDGELRTLSSLGIASINAQADVNLSKDNGNLVGLTSSYQTTDGTTHAAADVWFTANRNQNAASALPVDKAIAAINSTMVAAEPELGPQQAFGVDAPAAITVAPAAPAADNPVGAPPPDNLRTRVSGLAQAIGSFAEMDAPDKAASGLGVTAPGSLASTPSAAALAVVSMADVMKQFDANGNLIAVPGATVASTNTKTLTVPGIQDPTSTGFLASGNK